MINAPKPDSIDHLGIGIRRFGENQLHVGILHRPSTTDELHFLELQWHCVLRNHKADTKYLWIRPCCLNQYRAEQVAALCRDIWETNQEDGVPYGFSEPNACFDPEKFNYLIGPTRHGLTCATFVLAIFDVAGLPIIDYNSWQVREEDKAWQHSIIEKLIESGVAKQEHIELLKKDCEGIRYRPEEVAGATKETAPPVSFSVACVRGAEVLKLLTSPTAGPSV